MKKKIVSYPVLTLGLLVAWIAALVAVEWPFDKRVASLGDFYSPSAEAIASCARNGVALGPQGSVTRSLCKAKLIKICRDGVEDLNQFAWNESSSCWNAGYSKKQRVIEINTTASDVLMAITLTFIVLIGITATMALGEYLTARDALSEQNKRERLALGGFEPPRESSVHSAAKIAGLLWGKAERRAKAVKHSFDQGRAASTSAGGSVNAADGDALAEVQTKPAHHDKADA